MTSKNVQNSSETIRVQHNIDFPSFEMRVVFFSKVRALLITSMIVSALINNGSRPIIRLRDLYVVKYEIQKKNNAYRFDSDLSSVLLLVLNHEFLRTFSQFLL